MAQIGDTLSDEEVKGLVSKYGREKAAAFMSLDENAPDSEIQAVHKYGYSIPGLTPQQEHPKLFELTAEGAAGAAGKLGALMGMAAPITEAFVTGAPMAPVIGGLVAATAAGLATDYGLKKSGLGALLEKGSTALRKDIPEPQHGGRFGVPLNMIQNMVTEVTDPRAVGANVLEALPTLAATAAGAKAAMHGAKGISALSELLLGKPKIPVGKEAGALLGAMERAHPVPVEPEANPNIPIYDRIPKPPKPSTTGEMRAAMQEGRQARGEKVKAAKESAYSQAQIPSDFDAGVQQAVAEGLMKAGNAKGMMGKFEAQFSKAPKASQDVLSTMQSAAGKIDSMDKARAIQSQFADKAANIRRVLRSPSPSETANAEDALVYENASRAMDKYIKSFIPDKPLAALEAANKPFSGYSDLQTLAQKSNTGGKFSPKKFKGLWDTLTPERQGKLDPTGEIAKMVKEGNMNLLEKILTTAAGAGRAVAPRTAGRLAALIDKYAPGEVRFNAPPRPTVSPATMQKAGGIQALLAQQML